MNTPVAAPDPASRLLTLRGPQALSAFRTEKMLASLRRVAPEVQSVDAAYLHFVELARPLDSVERQVLDKLLTYGDAAEIGRAHV